MTAILSRDPWLIAVFLGILIPITGIIFGTVTSYLTRTRLAELDASLKHAMLDKLVAQTTEEVSERRMQLGVLCDRSRDAASFPTTKQPARQKEDRQKEERQWQK